MNLLILLKLLLLAEVISEDCEKCSNIVDPVCGMVAKRDGTSTTKQYHNICHLNRVKCLLEDVTYVQKVPEERCGMKTLLSRRVNDFSIVGAHQACNHTCPTYCIDVYDPVCATMAFKDSNGRNRFVNKPMINHCHVDLFSCSVGINISITHMNKCLKTTVIGFMSSMAALKSLGIVKARRRSSLTLNEPTDLEDHRSDKYFDEVELNQELEPKYASDIQDEDDEEDVSDPLAWIVILKNLRN